MKKQVKNLLLISLFFITISVIFTSCADVTPIKDCVVDKPYGFWSGLWHGFIAPWSFIGSLIWDDIAIYAVNNNGGWYDFGFVLGSGILYRSSNYRKNN
jgi:hypothetical protein